MIVHSQPRSSSVVLRPRVEKRMGTPRVIHQVREGLTCVVVNVSTLDSELAAQGFPVSSGG